MLRDRFHRESNKCLLENSYYQDITGRDAPDNSDLTSGRTIIHPFLYPVDTRYKCRISDQIFYIRKGRTCSKLFFNICHKIPHFNKKCLTTKTNCLYILPYFLGKPSFFFSRFAAKKPRTYKTYEA